MFALLAFLVGVLQCASVWHAVVACAGGPELEGCDSVNWGAQMGWNVPTHTHAQRNAQDLPALPSVPSVHRRAWPCRV
jgi:hypothetical protein